MRAWIVAQTMKLLVLSDLHLEFAGYIPQPGALANVDAVVLAGDIMPNVRKLPSWAARPNVFGVNLPIIVTLGNHEFYGGQLESRRRELQEAAGQFPNVHVLDPGQILLDGGRVRILGCTLWTNFEIPVQTGTGPVSDRARAIATADKGMSASMLLSVRRMARVNGHARGRSSLRTPWRSTWRNALGCSPSSPSRLQARPSSSPITDRRQAQLR